MLLRTLDVPFDPQRDFARLFGAHERAFLLESAEGPARLARYSLLGFDPAGTVRWTRGALETTGDLGVTPHDGEPPLAFLRRVIERRPLLDQGYRYLGGLVGHFSYEFIEAIERVEPRGRGSWPDFEFGLYLDGLVFDHLTRQVLYFSHGADRSREIEALAREKAPEAEVAFGPPSRNVNEARFHRMVETAKDHLHAGDIFQVVLAKRADMTYSGNLLAFYDALKRLNPSPYMYYMKEGDRTIVGASPEMLVRCDGGRVESFPIAGTRPLGATPEESDALARDLLADAKELAEHAMLVDLARNDVGRVAEFGTVRVPEYRRIERYSHVQHLVSKVEGRLRPGQSAFDALAAVFPAGTVSGAPKVEAMKIIRDLEPDARGPYAGAVGYFSFNGNADAAITIRTLVAERGRASVQAGAGIVYDSVPEREWAETESKARALLKAAGRDVA